MLLVILHMYTRTPSISTLPSPSYHWPSIRGTHRDERQVRGFQEWQPAFARSHIRIVGDPDVTSTQKRTKSPCVTMHPNWTTPAYTAGVIDTYHLSVCNLTLGVLLRKVLYLLLMHISSQETTYALIM